MDVFLDFKQKIPSAADKVKWLPMGEASGGAKWILSKGRKMQHQSPAAVQQKAHRNASACGGSAFRCAWLLNRLVRFRIHPDQNVLHVIPHLLPCVLGVAAADGIINFLVVIGALLSQGGVKVIPDGGEAVLFDDG